MHETTIPFDSFLTASRFYTPVPGPDRRRSVKPYEYRITYCSRDPKETGCAVVWEVLGGRGAYQVALEREENGRFRWHCTCADAVYRCESAGRVCKHVRGVLSLGRPREQSRTSPPR
jgi:hypothetical protein